MQADVDGALGYVRSIDGLRALAVLSILVFHLNDDWLPAGFVGVDIFFVISGFVVCTSALDREATRFRSFVTSFYARRMLRILPALLLCLLVTALASTLFVPQAWLSGANQRTGLAAFLAVSNFVLARLTGDYFAPHADFNPFTHTWSLGVEEQFYLVFPLLVYPLARRRESGATRRGSLAAIALLSLLSFGWCAASSSRDPTNAFYLIPSRFWELGVGVLLALLLPLWRRRGSAWPRGAVHAASSATLAALAASVVLPHAEGFPFPWAVLPVLATAAAIVLAVARPGSWWERWLALPALVGVGKRSYSLYLWHWPVFVLARWTIGLDSPGQLALACTITLLAALTSYAFVERPLRESARARGAAAPKIVGIGLASIAVTASIAAVTFRHRERLSASVTTRGEDWFGGGGLDTVDATGPYRIELTKSPLSGGTLFEYRPRGWLRGRPTLYVLGDSHAIAYAPMLREFASRTGVAVAIFLSDGCSLLTLRRPMAELPPECGPFLDASLALIGARARAGDVLFLSALRLRRYIYQRPPRIPEYAPPSQRARAAINEEALTLLRPLASRGVHVVLEGLKPIFKVPIFRCADWFNANNPDCRAGFEVPRDELLRRGSEMLSAIQSLVRELGNASVWDPFPVLCPPAASCSAFRQGRPLFFDGDHLSNFGNRLLLPSFSAHVRGVSVAAALEAPAPASASPPAWAPRKADARAHR